MQNEPQESGRERQVDLPSSPPSSQGGSDHNTYPNVATDQPTAEPRTPIQLSSPVSSPDRGALSTNTHKISSQQHRLRQGGLTSSVVKGEAASGLLELMRGGPGGDIGVPRSGGIGMCGL